MRSVKVTLGRDIRSLEIHTFSDWHIGDKSCDIDAIEKQIQYIREHENAYVICNGDLMNNATKASVSDCYAEELTPMEQLQTLCDLLEPIKDKILILTQGNHEARTYRNDGIDLTALLAKQLDIYDKYVREGGVLFLRFGETSAHTHHRPQLYSLYCTHGSGGGRKEGAKAIRLADMASIVDCDIYVHSHTHLPMVMKQNFFRIDTQNSNVAEVEKLFVNTSAQLKYGGYGQTYEFKPSNTTSPIIYLNGTRKEFAAKL
jgi:predicted phosphodiesterase